MSEGQQAPSEESPFEAIRREDAHENEYWSARDLAKVLGYNTNFRNFKTAVQKAEIACEKSGYQVEDHFARVRSMIIVGKGAKREIEDIHLSRYKYSES